MCQYGGHFGFVFKICKEDIYCPMKGYIGAKNEVYPNNRVRDIQPFQKPAGRTDKQTSRRTTSILLPSEFLRNRRRVTKFCEIAGG